MWRPPQAVEEIATMSPVTVYDVPRRLTTKDKT
jgi:hypothetical protein